MRWIEWTKDDRRYHVFDDGVTDKIKPRVVVQAFRVWLLKFEMGHLLRALTQTRERVERWAYGVNVPTEAEASFIEQCGGPTVRAWRMYRQALAGSGGLKRSLQRSWAMRGPAVEVRLYDVRWDRVKKTFDRRTELEVAELPPKKGLSEAKQERPSETMGQAQVRLARELEPRGWRLVVFPVGTPEHWSGYLVAPKDSLRLVFRERSVHYSLKPHPALAGRFGRLRAPDPRDVSAERYLLLLATETGLT